jgi:hypothetical protein
LRNNRLVQEPGWFSASLRLACKSRKILRILSFLNNSNNEQYN